MGGSDRDSCMARTDCDGWMRTTFLVPSPVRCPESSRSVSARVLSQRARSWCPSAIKSTDPPARLRRSWRSLVFPTSRSASAVVLAGITAAPPVIGSSASRRARSTRRASLASSTCSRRSARSRTQRRVRLQLARYLGVQPKTAFVLVHKRPAHGRRSGTPAVPTTRAGPSAARPPCASGPANRRDTSLPGLFSDPPHNHFPEKGGLPCAEQGLRRKLEAMSIPDVGTPAGILVERPQG